MTRRTWWIVLLVPAAVLGLVTLATLDGVLRNACRDGLPGSVRDAVAQETMTFQEVSPESAAALERRRRDRGGVPRAPEVPAMPGVPAPPAVPPMPPISRAGDVVRIGSNIHIEENQVVDGDVFALRGDIVVDGHVKGNVATTGGDVRLGPTARVDGDVMCIGGTLTEEDGAFVGGQRVTALRGRDVKIESGEDRPRRRWRDRHPEGAGFGFVISWMLLTTLVAWLLARFAPSRTQVAFQTLRDDPGASLMVGFLIVLLLIPSIVALALAVGVLCITIIGIPLAILLIPAYGLAVTLLFLWGFTIGVTAIGERFADRLGGTRTLAKTTMAGALVVGGMLFVAQVLHFIPFFGWISGLLKVLGWVTFGFVTLAGAGALVKSKFGQGPGGQWWPPFRRAPASPPPPGTPVSPAGPSPASAPAASSAPGPGAEASTYSAMPPAEPPLS